MVYVVSVRKYKRKMKQINKTIEFARQTYRLMFLLRYNIYPRIFNETVASHSYQVAILALYLSEQYNEKLTLDIEKLLKMALIHDVGEDVDIPHPIKDKYPIVKTYFEKEELEKVKILLGESYKDLLIEYNEGKTVESVLVEISDVIACQIYSEEEIKLGNTYFERVKKESIARLQMLIKKLEGFK